MNVNKAITADYENKTLGERGKNKPNTNPIQTQSNPIPEKAKMSVTSIITKGYENKPRFRAKAKQSQYKAKQSQFQRQKNTALHLFAVGPRAEKNMFFNRLYGKYMLYNTVFTIWNFILRRHYDNC